MVIRSHLLETLLHQFGVDTQLWGTGEAQTVKDLLSEMQAGENYLRIDASGLTRVIEVAKLHISQAIHAYRGYLIEVSQTLPGGCLVKRNAHPSETLKRGETSKQAVVRGIEEELKVAAHDIDSVKLRPVTIESRPSKSYPNLACLYIVHHAKVVLVNSVLICHQPRFKTIEDNGTVHHWAWERF